MTKNREIRECIKKIGRNEDVEKMLPAYAGHALRLHNEQARLKLMMEYYVFYETDAEGINPYMEDAKKTGSVLHEIIWTLFDGKNAVSKEKLQEMKAQIHTLREAVKEKMDVITAYVDRFVIYEYLMNRLQYRYDDKEIEIDDETFIQAVIQFIFGTEDNVLINDRIHMVLGQLPMRMTRKRYFDLIRESLSVYQDGDKRAMDGFLYMFRTSAMLYHTPAMEREFREFVPVLEEFAAFDYEQAGEEAYRLYAKKLSACTEKLNGVSDAYILLEQLVNDVYALVLTEDAATLEKIPAADAVIRGVCGLYTGRDSGLTDEEGLPITAEEDIIARLGVYFTEIEGRQEVLMESMVAVDAVADEIAASHQKTIERLGLGSAFEKIQMLTYLSSGSEFAELEGEKEVETLTADQVTEQAEALILQLKEAFGQHSRMVRRAVMANTINKMPVFFSTPQEVADYIRMSLSLCDDEAEKYISKILTMGMIEKDVDLEFKDIFG